MYASIAVVKNHQAESVVYAFSVEVDVLVEVDVPVEVDVLVEVDVPVEVDVLVEVDVPVEVDVRGVVLADSLGSS